jgi:hypothetical protein
MIREGNAIMNDDIDLEAILSAPATPSPKSASEAATGDAPANDTSTYGVFVGDYHDFAMVLRIEPSNRLSEWEQAILAAEAPEGMSVQVRKPTLVMFGVKADVEFLAIEMAMDWLNNVAACLNPPVTIRCNAQPSEEV